MFERPIIPPHGGYRGLRAFQVAEIVYDATVLFSKTHLDRKSRTVDQMVQAARSGRQNIAEGSRASGTSRKTEIVLTNVARASLEELLLDYEDFLRHNGFEKWGKDHEKSLFIRNISKRNAAPAYADYSKYIESKGPENAANTIICLVHQANYLLDQLIRHLESSLITDGGISERITAARKQSRSSRKNQPDQSDPSDQSNPSD